MPPEKAQPANGAAASQNRGPSPFTRQVHFIRDLFAVPGPVKRLFDHVPVVVYAANELPQRSPKTCKLPSLYVFTSDLGALAGQPSFNPTCLKWQAFLRIAGIKHRLISSNNHASPTGSLPFLLPPQLDSPPRLDPESLLPVPAHRLVRYARDHGTGVAQPESMRYEAYQALLDHRIRHAWLYTLYLVPSNFAAVATPLYIDPVSRNALVRATISAQLRRAAEAELLKHSSVIDVGDNYAQADAAFEALSVLLGEDDTWFFSEESPSLFDASVFAYTHLLLDERGMAWKEKRLVNSVRRHGNLIRHRERFLGRYFREGD